MEIRNSTREAVRVVSLKGELDLFNSPKLKENVVKLFNEGATELIVDFEEVGYIDSAGIGSLLFLFAEAKKRTARIFFTNIHGTVKRVITLTKLERYFPILGFVDDAIKKLKE